MNFVVHGSTVFGSVMFDFKALALSFKKLGNTNNLQNEKLDVKFL